MFIDEVCCNEERPVGFTNTTPGCGKTGIPPPGPRKNTGDTPCCGLDELVAIN